MKTFIAVRFTDSGVANIGKIVYHQFFLSNSLACLVQVIMVAMPPFKMFTKLVAF